MSNRDNDHDRAVEAHRREVERMAELAADMERTAEREAEYRGQALADFEASLERLRRS